MEECLSKFKSGLSDSKEVDEMLVARANFSDFIKIGGYKKITEFDTSYDVFGITAMYDVIVEGAEKLKEYRKFLKDQGMSRVKAVFAIFSDGIENGSQHSFNEAKQAIASLNKEEITTSFIAFGGGSLDEANNLGFRNVLDVEKIPGEDLASKLRKAFNCLSKSVIESSKSVMSDDADDFFQI